MNIAKKLEENAKISPNRVALIFENNIPPQKSRQLKIKSNSLPNSSNYASILHTLL